MQIPALLGHAIHQSPSLKPCRFRAVPACVLEPPYEDPGPQEARKKRGLYAWITRRYQRLLTRFYLAFRQWQADIKPLFSARKENNFNNLQVRDCMKILFQALGYGLVAIPLFLLGALLRQSLSFQEPVGWGKDYYSVLGVKSTVPLREVKRAYRTEARACHPDTHPNDPVAAARFQEILEAYTVLKDPRMRAQYDEFR